MGKIFSSVMLNNRQPTNYISRTFSLCLLVLGAAVVVGDPGPGSVPVGTLGWDASGLWHFGRHALHPEKKISIQSFLNRSDEHLYLTYVDYLIDIKHCLI